MNKQLIAQPADVCSTTRDLPPMGWTSCQLKEICAYITDGDHQPPPKADSGVPFIVISNIKNHIVDLSDTRFVPQAYYDLLHDSKKPQYGDILYTVTGSFGIPCFIDFEKEFCFQRHIGLVRLREEICKRFIFHLLRSPLILEQAERSATGTAQKTIPLSGIRSFKIPVPPLNEQKRISDKLDILLGRVDACRERLERVPSLLKRFRQSVLAAAVSGKLTEDWRHDHPGSSSAALLSDLSERKVKWVKQNTKHNEADRVRKRAESFDHTALDVDGLPQGWCWAEIEDAALMVVDCHNKTAPYAESGIPLVRTSNIRFGKIVWDNMRFVTEETYSYWARRCPPEPGDILFTREAPMGEATLVPAGTKVCLGVCFINQVAKDRLLEPNKR